MNTVVELRLLVSPRNEIDPPVLQFRTVTTEGPIDVNNPEITEWADVPVVVAEEV